MASTLTSQLNYRSTIRCSDIVVVCAHLLSSNSVHCLLWCCVQSMFSIIAVYVICNNNNNVGEEFYEIIFIIIRDAHQTQKMHRKD